MTLTADQERYWHAYLAQTSDQPSAGSEVTASRPGGPEIADALIALLLQGRKTAGSGLVEDYARAGDPLPQVGDHWIALDSLGVPRCILRTVRIETHTFVDVPERIAVAECEGDLSLKSWRTAHSAVYAAHLKEWGLSRIDDATVITEFFELVYAVFGVPLHTVTR